MEAYTVLNKTEPHIMTNLSVSYDYNSDLNYISVLEMLRIKCLKKMLHMVTHTITEVTLVL